MQALTGKQRRHLRALGQALRATLNVGHEGVSEALVRQAEALLEAHELIKVRVGDNAPDDRHATAEALAQRTRAHLAQVVQNLVGNALVHGEPNKPVHVTVDGTEAEDEFEAAFSYERVPVMLASGRQAWVYVHANHVEETP